MRIPRVPQSPPKRYPTTEETKDSTISPQKGILPLPNKLYPAISPRRRRMTEFGKPNSVSRSQTISSCLGRHQIGEQSDLHKLYPCHPHIKVLRSFSKSDRLPRSPRPPFLRYSAVRMPFSMM